MHTAESQYRALLPQLLAFYPTISFPRIKAAHFEVAHVAHGWYMRCHRGVEAVLQFERTGYATVAARGDSPRSPAVRHAVSPMSRKTAHHTRARR